MNDDQPEKSKNKWICIHKKATGLSIALILIIFAVVMVTLTFYYIHDFRKIDENNHFLIYDENEKALRIVSQDDWHQDLSSIKLLALPADRIVILDTFSKNCSDKVQNRFS